jgi:retron-type reverse transcriptase
MPVGLIINNLAGEPTGVEQKFNGVKWIVEGDIKGAYDNIDHKILIGILE